jgi:Uncharacterized protein conserved in bacteria (DUF2059)
MFLPRLALLALLTAAAPVAAETPVPTPGAEASAERVGEVLQLDALFDVLRDEGLAHGRQLEMDMFPAGGGEEWAAAVDRIYDAERLRAEFGRVLQDQLASDPSALGAIVDFFAADLGRRIVGLEIEARRAFLDEASEEAARVAADDAASARDPKVAQVRRMIEASDLLEMNVAGAMTGNLAFMQGMATSGAYGRAMPEDELLSQIWGQEEQTRADTSTWLYAFLGLAYHPLTEAEYDSYIAFWESPAGKRLNAALFTAFDQVFRQVSFDLGAAAGRAMQGRDI